MTLHDVAGDGSIAVGTASQSGPIVADPQRVRSLEDLLVNEYGVDLQGWTLTDPDLWLSYRPTPLSADGRTIAGRGLRPDGTPGAYLVRLPPACSDGLDNDGDGWIDYPDDPGCARRLSDVEEPQCDDGLDNDADGATDDADANCLSRSVPFEGCGWGFELALLPPAVVWARRSGRRRRLPEKWAAGAGGSLTRAPGAGHTAATRRW